MDHTRFDALTRALGANRTRRGALRALAASAAAVALGRQQPATAQTGWLDLGDSCQGDLQCLEGVCDYIVQTADTRCCAYEGGRCGGDHMCCGSLVCGAGDFNGAACERPQASCDWYGCPCTDVPGACEDGLMCCQSGEPGADGTCVSVEVCYPEAASCTGWGCDCDFHLASPCDAGLMCCAVAGRFICAAGDACAW